MRARACAWISDKKAEKSRIRTQRLRFKKTYDGGRAPFLRLDFCKGTAEDPGDEIAPAATPRRSCPTLLTARWGIGAVAEVGNVICPAGLIECDPSHERGTVREAVVSSAMLSGARPGEASPSPARPAASLWGRLGFASDAANGSKGA